MRHFRAFTLIELILVILIISTLAVTIVPKFFGASSIAHTASRDQLISLLRLSQLKAMNQIGICNGVVITSDYMVIENNTSGTCGTEEDSEQRILLDDISINIDSTTPSYPLFIQFDGQGLSIGNDCNSSCTLNIVGVETAELKIESQGYIHAL